MSVRFDHDRGKFVVRWWDDGKRRCRRFDLEPLTAMGRRRSIVRQRPCVCARVLLERRIGGRHAQICAVLHLHV